MQLAGLICYAGCIPSIQQALFFPCLLDCIAFWIYSLINNALWFWCFKSKNFYFFCCSIATGRESFCRRITSEGMGMRVQLISILSELQSMARNGRSRAPICPSRWSLVQNDGLKMDWSSDTRGAQRMRSIINNNL